MIPYANNIKPTALPKLTLNKAIPKPGIRRINGSIKGALFRDDAKWLKTKKASRLTVCIGMQIRNIYESSKAQDFETSLYADIVYKKIQQAELIWASVDLDSYDRTLKSFEKVHKKMIKELPKSYNINVAIMLSTLYDSCPNDFRNYTTLSEFNFIEMRKQADSANLDREIESNGIVKMFLKLMREELKLKGKVKTPSWMKVTQ